MAVKILVVDNYDSFTYNLVQYLGELGAEVEVVRNDKGIPVLGVCLGHQSMVEAFGGRTIRGEPVHGKDARIEHDGRGVYRGLPNPLTGGRYHSLVADPDLPDSLQRTATFGDVVMGVRHRSLPAEGVQFHPESVLTPHGKQLLRNFLDDDAGQPVTGD